MIFHSDATIADGPDLDAMARECWVATFAGTCSPEDMALYVAEAYGPQGRLLRDLADPAWRFRIARDGPDVAGYAKLGACWLPAETAPADAIQLSQLYVLPRWQGAGIARALMDWTLDTARAEGAPTVVLTTWEENARAIAFYTRYGFREVGEYRFMTGNQADRDIVLRLDL